ncbi:ABC transporter ATP-binding protein [Limisalsivibrio acetivorans]|uniref:ABC transporter ATP-binding protein n=1 Tax=Limisalsivibrio acetivorans TaxID=1304888 RepID=UPI0003B4BBD2|nr:ABC transporter ATP-binding protein [Limisalsivibrio acetivorans]
MLDVQGISVRFGGVKALTDVSFSIKEGGISALIGPNGAGKTTMFNAVTGFVTPSEGRVEFNGEDITAALPHKVFDRGISRTFQNLNIIPELSLRENMYLGIIGKEKPGGFKSVFRLNKSYWKSSAERIDRYLELAGVKQYENLLPGSVPYGVLKNFELARAVLSKPRLLLLDEPAAGLNIAEKETLAMIVRKVSDEGVTILMVEHDMDFISSLAEYVVCLNFGEVLAKGTYDEIRSDDAVLKAYLGDEDA